MSATERAGATGSAAPAADRGANGELLTEKTFVYSLTRFVTRTALRTVWRARFEGLEHLPESGQVMIASNHQSLLDIPLIAAATRRHVSFVARDTLASFSPMAFLMRQCGAVLVRRGTADRAALSEMIAHLDAGDAIAMFPEGTRSTDGSLGEFQGGAFFAARRTGAPIVPAAIRGGCEAWPRNKKLPRPSPMAIRFAPAVDPRAKDAAERVRAAIAERLGAGGFDDVPPE